MRVKTCAVKARLPRLKVVMTKEGDKYITHIYRSRDCFRMDELARYKQKAFKTLVHQAVASALATKEGEKE